MFNRFSFKPSLASYLKRSFWTDVINHAYHLFGYELCSWFNLHYNKPRSYKLFWSVIDHWETISPGSLWPAGVNKEAWWCGGLIDVGWSLMNVKTMNFITPVSTDWGHLSCDMDDDDGKWITTVISWSNLNNSSHCQRSSPLRILVNCLFFGPPALSMAW